jgi:predicted amidohydrolase
MIRAAACQIQPEERFEKRLAQAAEVLHEAGKQHIDFLCFPEGFLTGYYSNKAQAEANSLKPSDPIFHEFVLSTAPFSTTFMMGFNEKDGDYLYDSVAVIEKGSLLGIQRKHYLYHPYFTASSTYRTFVSKGITFGCIICLDSNYFEPARLLALQGATILFCPMCNKVPLDHRYAVKPLYYSQFVARSFENRCWLIGADWAYPSDGELVCPGHSVIYDPDGQEINRSASFQNALLVVDIPRERLMHEKGLRVHGSKLLNTQLAGQT